MHEPANSPTDDQAEPENHIVGDPLSEPADDPPNPPTPPGPDLSGDDWISVKDALIAFAAAGLPRNERSVRRYCRRGDLVCHRTENAQHQPQWRVSHTSLQLFLDQERSLSGPRRTRPDAVGHDSAEHEQPTPAEIAGDASGHARTGPEASGRTDMLEFLIAQIGEKDTQINALLERDRETNILVQGLQRLVLALQMPNASEQERDRDAAEAPRWDGDNPSAQTSLEDVE
jgi:hypothetical protein